MICYIQVALRNACRDEELDLVSRVHLLEIIELRAMNWLPNENVSGYYKQKLSQIDYDGMPTPSRDSPQIHTAPVTLNANAPDFGCRFYIQISVPRLALKIIYCQPLPTRLIGSGPLHLILQAHNSDHS